jgi:hypothetical protein
MWALLEVGIIGVDITRRSPVLSIAINPISIGHPAVNVLSIANKIEQGRTYEIKSVRMCGEF